MRVFRDSKLYSKFFAFKKHGGKMKTWQLARQEELRLERMAGPPSPARRRGDPATRPNSNSTTGIEGIQIFFLNKRGYEPILQFVARWRTGPAGNRRYGSIQRSVGVHGLFGALGQVLDARAQGTGLPMPSPRKAWAIINKHVSLHDGEIRRRKRS